MYFAENRDRMSVTWSDSFACFALCLAIIAIVSLVDIFADRHNARADFAAKLDTITSGAAPSARGALADGTSVGYREQSDQFDTSTLEICWSLAPDLASLRGCSQHRRAH